MSAGWRRASAEGREYRRIRAAVLARDGGRCQLRFDGEWVTRSGEVRHCMGAADCVHHTRGIQVTGHDPAYMVAACTPCNLRVGEPDVTVDPPHRAMTQW